MIYAIYPIQIDLIDKHCFKVCKKLSLATVEIGKYGHFFVCPFDKCEFEEKRTPIIGQAFNDDVCIRKLKDAGTGGVRDHQKRI